MWETVSIYIYYPSCNVKQFGTWSCFRRHFIYTFSKPSGALLPATMPIIDSDTVVIFSAELCQVWIYWPQQHTLRFAYSWLCQIFLTGILSQLGHIFLVCISCFLALSPKIICGMPRCVCPYLHLDNFICIIPGSETRSHWWQSFQF